MKSAVAFSGGYDSTYLLYKLLSETDDEITAISFQRPVGTQKNNKNWFVQTDASPIHIPQIIDELQKIRSFTHITRIVEDTEITDQNSEATVFFIEQYVSDINSGKYDRLVSGRSWEQWNEYRVNYMLGTLTDISAQRVFFREAKRGEFWMPLVTDAFHEKYCRWHVLKYLPENLKKLTISCSDPTIENGKVIRCEECHKCMWDDKVKWMMDQGWNADQVNTWKFLKGLQYGGGKNISAPTRLWMPVEFGKGKIFYNLDTKEKIARHVQTQRNWSIAFRKNEGIWKF